AAERSVRTDAPLRLPAIQPVARIDARARAIPDPPRRCDRTNHPGETSDAKELLSGGGRDPARTPRPRPGVARPRRTRVDQAGQRVEVAVQGVRLEGPQLLAMPWSPPHGRGPAPRRPHGRPLVGITGMYGSVAARADPWWLDRRPD